ncbi:MAG: hypothetical protein ACJ763_15460 [Bdellovibrionia bacterium]
MQKHKESDKQTESTSSTYAGKAEKGDTSGRVGESRVPSRGSTTGAAVDHDQVHNEEASNAGGQWDENSPGLSPQDQERKKKEKPPKAA